MADGVKTLAEVKVNTFSCSCLAFAKPIEIYELGYA